MIYVLSGGQTGATLTVTSSGAGTITVSNTSLGKSYSKSVTAGGSAVFKGLVTGTWTVKLSNGTQTSTKTITITSDYSTSIAYFSATIKVTYPAKSKCVIKNSSGTQVASNTNTGTSAKTWTATVNAKGTYTVTATATDGSGKTKSTTVSITAEGQVETVTLVYETYLFREGIGQITPFTSTKEENATVSINANGIVMNYTSGSHGQVGVGTTNMVDLSNYSKIIFDAICNSTTTDNEYTNAAVVINTKKIDYTGRLSEFKAYNAMVPDGVRREYAIDISSFNAKYYIGAKGLIDGTIYNIWLE